MDFKFFEKLHAEGLISDVSFAKIKARLLNQLFSLHWEIKTILYLGVLLFTTGTGILVYKNINTIGHQVILLFIALVCLGTFFYCFKRQHIFSWNKVQSPDVFFDYILLLACLTFITFVGYLQFQYNVFGNRYGLATLIPMIVLFVSAYYFDNVAILSLAITNLAVWVGITVTPLRILKSNDFDNSTIIISGLLLGAALVMGGTASKRKELKPHFEFTYTNFGMHLLFISCLAAMFHFETMYFLWFLLLCGLSYCFYRKAVLDSSFYFLLILSIYFYIGVSYVVIRLLFSTLDSEMGGLYLLCLYFITSAIALTIFLIRMNQKLKNT